jgi:hypothetical protein
MIDRNIGEGCRARDHNIDRKESAAERCRGATFSVAWGRREHESCRATYPSESLPNRIAGIPPQKLMLRNPSGRHRLLAKRRYFANIGNFAAKRIPLLLKML